MEDKYLGLTECRRNKLQHFFSASRWISGAYTINNVGTLASKKNRRKMSSVCQNFVQNTWKKDFCSNCFKSKDEHAINNNKVSIKSNYFSTTFNSNKQTSPFKSLKNGANGILRSSPKKKQKRAVSFSQEVSQVIGYGGDAWSDDEEFQMSEVVEEDDFIPDCDEDKQLKLLTKSNTDFNTVKANLLGSNGDVKKSYTSLLLGKMQTDSDGKRKTLLVSVTPFGHENSTVKSSIAKLSEKKQSNIPVINKNSDKADYKTNIILTSFVKNYETTLNNNNNCRKDSETDLSEKSLLEEISETLEKNRITNGNNNNTETAETNNNKENSNATINEKLDQNTANETAEQKKNALTRNPPIKRDSEKPKITVLTKPEFKFCKIDIEPIKSIDKNDSANNNRTNNYSSEFAKNNTTSDEDSTCSKSDSDSDDHNFLDNCNSLKNSEDTLKIQVFSNSSDTDDKTSTDISLEDIRKVDGQSDSLQDTYEPHYQPQILDMPVILPKLDQNVIFTPEASRELAGEPDGRADPDESEPPALPKSPPPQVDPRPSFLHGIFKDTNGRPIVPEKPKVPVKPLSVMKQLAKRPQANVIPQQQQLIMQLQQTLNYSNPTTQTIEVQSNDVDVTDNKVSEVTISYDSDSELLSKSTLVKQDSNNSAILTPNKRKAPKPPPSGVNEEPSGNIYQRNPTANVKSDSPVVREKEKRERASSCSPKFRQGVNTNPTGNTSKIEKLPEPAPRRSLSLSQDNLLGDEKKKGKMKFSLRKFLKLGSSKDLDSKKDFSISPEADTLKKENYFETTPKPRPRLVIIHPLELNGSSVEVLKNANETGKQSGNDNLSISDGSTYSGGSLGDVEENNYKDAQNKPPPPPRKSSSSENHVGSDGNSTKPARPPPPKSVVLQRQQVQSVQNSNSLKPADNVYANLGEVRSAIAPRKPERTASMREREAQLELPKKRINASDDSDCDIDVKPSKPENKISNNESTNHNYDDVYNSDKYENKPTVNNNTMPTALSHNRNGSDNDYEFVSNCTSTPKENIVIRKQMPPHQIINRTAIKTFVPSYRKSDCNIDKSSEYMKFSNSFIRSSSLQYCGSETESEIYSPYSFYSCSELNDDGSEFNSASSTTNKLRVRKGRSVVHKNLEDNYGAVVVANHEALAQVLDQVQQSAVMQPSLRGLKACTNLRWSDFTVTSQFNKATGFLKVGKKVFHSAVWNSNSANGAVNVTLMLHKEQMTSQLVSQNLIQLQSLCLNAVTEFCDLIPLQQFGEEGDQLVQATVVVLARTQIDTIQTFGDYLNEKCLSSPNNTLQKGTKINSDILQSSEIQHEATFMMLQLINALKCLQARGVEEVSSSLSSFVICRDSQTILKNQQNGSTNHLDACFDETASSVQMPKANTYGRLCILQGLNNENNCVPTNDKTLSLCECGITALKLLLPNNKLSSLLLDLLKKEKSVSLSQVKSILEFTLWGPWDVVSGLPINERELSLQRWLDLERATVLHGLVQTRVQLNVFEQSHLMFLVRSNSKIMCDTSFLLESSNIY